MAAAAERLSPHPPKELAAVAETISLADQRVLVTGARGFVAGHLVAALRAAGATAIGLDLPVGGDADPAWIAHRLELGAGRVDDLADLLAADAPVAVFHLAGQSSAGASFDDPPGTVRANLLGTLDLLEALRRLQERDAPVPRLLAVGSAEEYGLAARPDRPCREDDPVLPVSPYATSKAAATQLCVQYHRRFGLPVIPVRAFNHTGPGQDVRFVFPSFAAQIAAIEAGRREPVLHTGDLGVARDFLDVRDVAAAYLALAERGTVGRVYNVCSGSALTIERGLQILLESSGTAIEVVPDPARMRPAEVACLFGDATALGEATGWRPRIGIDRTLRDVLEHARETLT
jgi:GDP-4-dehydro-6-deoxy-D-mannose reductase